MNRVQKVRDKYQNHPMLEQAMNLIQDFLGFNANDYLHDIEALRTARDRAAEMLSDYRTLRDAPETSPNIYPRSER